MWKNDSWLTIDEKADAVEQWGKTAQGGSNCRALL